MNVYLYITSQVLQIWTLTYTVTRLDQLHFSLLQILFVNHFTEIYLLTKDTVQVCKVRFDRLFFAFRHVVLIPNLFQFYTSAILLHNLHLKCQDFLLHKIYNLETKFVKKTMQQLTCLQHKHCTVSLLVSASQKSVPCVRVSEAVRDSGLSQGKTLTSQGKLIKQEWVLF